MKKTTRKTKNLDDGGAVHVGRRLRSKRRLQTAIPRALRSSLGALFFFFFFFAGTLISSRVRLAPTRTAKCQICSTDTQKDRFILLRRDLSWDCERNEKNEKNEKDREDRKDRKKKDKKERMPSVSDG